MHVLNEIGRALSSTLNKEDLLRKVWEELRRLFDVENFYIVELDPSSDELTFDLEMIDGVRMPKRTRPSGNHFSEYIIRTRQPVLIRENFVEEVQKPWRRTDPFARLLLRRAACWLMTAPSAPWECSPTPSAPSTKAIWN